jgi:hypothetical protein
LSSIGTADRFGVTLDEPVDVFGKLADETPFELESL